MRSVLGAVLCAALAACGSSEPTLSQAEMDALNENLSESNATHSDVTAFVQLVALGQADLSGYVYTPPSAANGWVGTIVGTDVTLDSGAVGDLFATFTVTGDNGPTDPYLEDVSDDASVVLDTVMSFDGTSAIGEALSLDGDFSVGTSASGDGTREFELDGTFDVVHGLYDAQFAAMDFAILLDEATEEALAVTGSIAAVIDLPSYDFDANFLLEGFGTSIEATLSAGGSFLHFAFDLLGP